VTTLFAQDWMLEITKTIEASRLTLLDQIPFPAAICDLDGLFVYSNPRFSQSTGYTREEVENKMMLWDLNRGADKGACRHVFESSKNFGLWGWIPVQWVHKEGNIIHGRTKGARIQIGDNEYMLSVLDVL
jgi:PAS domain S-box-containing protein